MEDSTRERQKLAWENISYSERRIDLLLITISGGGIYVCLETIKYLSDKNRELHWLIWLAGIFFLTTIIINFVGQFFGKKVNELEYLWCQAKIDAGDQPSRKDKKEINELRTKTENIQKWINPINWICTVLMILGLSSILIYFIIFL